MTEPIAYLNGKMIPASKAKIDIFDSGVVLGATVTEMARTFRHKLFRISEHLERLQNSLNYVRFDTGIGSEELASILEELAEHNTRLINPEDDLALVLFITAGGIPTYAASPEIQVSRKPTICAHTFPLAFENWTDEMQKGTHVVTPSIRHIPPQCFAPNMKCRSRMHLYLADNEAKMSDPKALALLLDLEGNVTETTRANFMIVENGTIVSPPLNNILPGISRATIRDLAEKIGIPFIERTFQVFQVINADEAFTGSTPYCMMPVTKINGLDIGDGKPGPVFQKLISAWSQDVGLDILKQIHDGAKRRIASQ
jgi:branched-chain amino acid aminotransferase